MEITYPKTCTSEDKLSYLNRAMRLITDRHNANALIMPLDEFRAWQEGKFKPARDAIGRELGRVRAEAAAIDYPKGYAPGSRNRGAVYAYRLRTAGIWENANELAAAHLGCEADETWDKEITRDVISAL